MTVKKKPFPDELIEAQIEAKQLETNNTLVKIAKEKQFNRKVEINAHWRQLNQQLQELSR